MSVDYTVYLAEDSVAIFLLHGVVRSLPWKVRNYNRKHIELDYFVSVMRQLKENGHPIDMETIVECQLAGIPLPPRSFAITFDDGFENNYSVAAPALAELNIPATFYLTTSFVGTSRCSWIDRIEAVVERHCNASLHVPWRNSPVSYESPTEAIKLLEEIRSRVKQDSSLNPEQVADELAGQLMGNGMAPFDTALDGKLSWEQVLAMQADPLFCIGGHSHTHAILGFLDRDGQKNRDQHQPETDQTSCRHIGPTLFLSGRAIPLF